MGPYVQPLCRNYPEPNIRQFNTYTMLKNTMPLSFSLSPIYIYIYVHISYYIPVTSHNSWWLKHISYQLQKSRRDSHGIPGATSGEGISSSSLIIHYYFHCHPHSSLFSMNPKQQMVTRSKNGTIIVIVVIDYDPGSNIVHLPEIGLYWHKFHQ